MPADPSQTPVSVPVAELEYEHSPLEDAVIRYRRQLITVAILVVVGTAGYFGSKIYKEQKHKEAALAFTRATTPGDLRGVAAAWAGQTAAGNAHLKAAQLLAEEGKYKDAIQELNQLLAITPPHPLAELGKFRLAEAMMKEGATQDAVAKFQELASVPGSPYAALAQLRVADQAWLEGKTEDAKRLYQEVLTKHGGDQVFSIAEQRLKDLRIAPPVPGEFVPEPPPSPGSTPPGFPGANMAPPSAAALEKTIDTPGLSLGDDPPAAPGGESGSLSPDPSPEAAGSLLPPPVLPSPAPSGQ